VPAAAGVLAVDDASGRVNEWSKRLRQDFSGRSLAGFGGQRLSNRPMRREQCRRSVELCWPAITVVAEWLLLVGDRWEVDLARSRCELGSDCIYRTSGPHFYTVCR
jgi:hypothetical protein